MNRVAVATAFLLSPLILPAQTPPKIGGTYAIWICAKACSVADTASSAVSGFVVLDDYGLDLTSIPLRARYQIKQRSSSFLRGERINGCFALTRRDPTKIDMLAGSVPEGLTTVGRRGDTIDVTLYASPDAHYVLHAVNKNGVLGGGGRESGFIGSWFNKSAGMSYARRVGPPDIGKCFSDELVKRYESDSTFSDPSDLAVLRTLERRDEGDKSHNFEVASSAYSRYGSIVDVFGKIYEGTDSIRAYHRLHYTKSLGNRSVGRKDWPWILVRNGSETAYVEEYFETLDRSSSSARAPALTHFRRISLLVKSGNQWLIEREITLEERKRE